MTRSFLAVALALSAIACSHSSKESAAAARPPSEGAVAGTPAPAPAPGTEACAMGIPGTQVAAVDTADGAAIDFSTSPDKVLELRQAVRDMVAAHREAQREAQSMHGEAQTGEAVEPAPQQPGGTGTGAAGPGAGGETPVSPPMAGSEAMPGMHGMTMGPPASASVEDTPDGARVVFTPSDANDVDRLRSAVRLRAQRMQDMACGRQSGM